MICFEIKEEITSYEWIDWLIDWLFDWLIDWLIDWLVFYTVSTTHQVYNGGKKKNVYHEIHKICLFVY